MSETGDQPKVGRPRRVPLVDPTIADEVCEWIAEGKTLRSYCRQPGKPARRTIDEWRAQDDEFAARVARARDIGFDQIADECMHIADDDSGDAVVDDDGRERLDSEFVQRSKVRIETRLKLLACWDPRRYGNKPADGESAIASAAKLLADLNEIDLRSGAQEPDAP